MHLVALTPIRQLSISCFLGEIFLFCIFYTWLEQGFVQSFTNGEGGGGQNVAATIFNAYNIYIYKFAIWQTSTDSDTYIKFNSGIGRGLKEGGNSYPPPLQFRRLSIQEVQFPEAMTVSRGLSLRYYSLLWETGILLTPKYIRLQLFKLKVLATNFLNNVQTSVCRRFLSNHMKSIGILIGFKSMTPWGINFKAGISSN